MAIRQPEKIIDQVNFLKGQRGNWETHWQELAEFILPRKDDITRNRVPGEKRTQFLLDNTAMQSNELLSGFLHGLLTNPNSQFFELTTGVPEIDDEDDVRIWLQDTSRRIMQIFNDSNFQTEIHEVYIDLGCFGTAAMTIEEDDDTVVRFAARPIQSIFIEEDNKGQIVEVHRKFAWNVNQIIAEFGEQTVKDSKLLSDAKKRDDPKKFDIIHSIYPKEVDPTKRSDSPWQSQYILVDERKNLRTSSFRQFPYLVPRWTKHSGEKYGRSPGMNALPEQKTLNIMTETTIKGAQKVVDPPLQVPDDGFISVIRTRPGSLNFFRAGSKDRIEPVFNDARIDFGFQAMEAKRENVRDAYFVNQLQLRQSGPQMTATEVEARVEQALRFMGPVLGRQQVELLRPLIDRTFDIMLRRGLIAPPPEVLQGSTLGVEYSSLIARTQRQQEARAILRAVEQSTPFIQSDPTVLDNINGDEALRIIWRINNANQKILRDQGQITKIRQDRAAEQQALIEREEASQTAEDVGKAGPSLVAAQQQGT